MQYTYTKGGNIGTLSYQEKGDATRTYTYEYATDDKLTKATLPDKSVLTYSYDSLRRSNKTVYTPKSGVADSKKLYTTLQYQPSHFTVDGKTKNTTTDLVSTYTNKFGSSGTPVSEFTYTYDAWGNITNIKDQSARQKTYTYDNGGNILTETRGSTRHTYTYDSVWKDKLIAYDGKTITYDEQGRPTNYLGKTMTWDNTGHLTAIDNTIRYTYLSDGQRYTKTVNGKTTTYHYNNGMLLSEQTGDETLRYYYDATGKVTSFTYKKGSYAEVSYFYTRNLQGDIIAIYRNSDSALIGTYEYDLWGRLVSETEIKGIDTDGILAKNPFRYRGYYYDTETGFYNLSARYYDPEIRRFISADNLIASPGTSVQGYNLFAYCDNNPVNKVDYTGRDGDFIELRSGWYYRIDAPNDGTRTQQHIHVWNKRIGTEYMQNEDGSPHDKSKGEKGKIPKWLNKKIVEKESWDYNTKQKLFLENAVCTHIEMETQYSYGDGTTVFQADNLFMKHTNSIAELEGVYYQGDISLNSMGYSAPLFLIPIVNPFTIPLSSYESGWTLLPIPLAG